MVEPLRHRQTKGAATDMFSSLGSQMAQSRLAAISPTTRHSGCEIREWDRPAVLPPRTAQRIRWGFEARGAHRHVPKTAATVAHTIGIDTGKNTLHLIGLDDKGAIVLREKVARDRITARLANVPQRA